jgi:hypothetical protein
VNFVATDEFIAGQYRTRKKTLTHINSPNELEISIAETAQYNDGLRSEQPELDSRQRQGTFLYSAAFTPALGAHPATRGCRGLFRKR